MKRPILATALILLDFAAVCALYVAGQVLLPRRDTQDLHDSLLRSAINERAQPPPLLSQKRDANGKYVPPTAEEQLRGEFGWMHYAALEQAKAHVVLNVTVAEMRTAERAAKLYYGAFALLLANCLIVLCGFFILGPKAAASARPQISQGPPTP